MTAGSELGLDLSEPDFRIGGPEGWQLDADAIATVAAAEAAAITAGRSAGGSVGRSSSDIVEADRVR